MAKQKQTVLILRTGLEHPEQWKEAVEAQGFRSEYTLTVRQTVTLLDADNVCALICAHKPRGVKADDTLHAVAEVRKDLPIVVSIVIDEPQATERFLKAGAKQVVPKDADPKTILQALKSDIAPLAGDDGQSGGFFKRLTKLFTSSGETKAQARKRELGSSLPGLSQGETAGEGASILAHSSTDKPERIVPQTTDKSNKESIEHRAPKEEGPKPAKFESCLGQKSSRATVEPSSPDTQVKPWSGEPPAGKVGGMSLKNPSPEKRGQHIIAKDTTQSSSVHGVRVQEPQKPSQTKTVPDVSKASSPVAIPTQLKGRDASSSPPPHEPPLKEQSSPVEGTLSIASGVRKSDLTAALSAMDAIPSSLEIHSVEPDAPAPVSEDSPVSIERVAPSVKRDALAHSHGRPTAEPAEVIDPALQCHESEPYRFELDGVVDALVDCGLVQPAFQETPHTQMIAGKTASQAGLTSALLPWLDVPSDALNTQAISGGSAFSEEFVCLSLSALNVPEVKDKDELEKVPLDCKSALSENTTSEPQRDNMLKKWFNKSDAAMTPDTKLYPDEAQARRARMPLVHPDFEANPQGTSLDGSVQYVSAKASVEPSDVAVAYDVAAPSAHLSIPAKHAVSTLTTRGIGISHPSFSGMHPEKININDRSIPEPTGDYPLEEGVALEPQEPNEDDSSVDDLLGETVEFEDGLVAVIKEVQPDKVLLEGEGFSQWIDKEELGLA